MGLPRPVEHLTHDEYVDGEQYSEVRHEYVAGEVYAMSGASTNHGRIVQRLASLLEQHLRGRRCEAFSQGQMVHMERVDATYYPDVVVTSDPRDIASRRILEHPTIVVEVLSPSTEDIDRSRKYKHYRTLPSLKEYVLIAQDRLSVEHYTLNDDGSITIRFFGEGDRLNIRSIDFSCAIDDLYERVDFTQGADEESGSRG